MSGKLYDFTTSFFRKRPQYIRLAKEHLAMIALAEKSTVIAWEVKGTTDTKVKIPLVYHVHYNIKSITGIDEEQNPIYGNQHTAELTLPTRYPMEPCQLYMKTDIWHPNIKSEGKFVGRICGNARNFGKSYTLDNLTIRIGEILQYKNYLAAFVPPYPEDSKVAKWVNTFAEPNGIVNKDKGIVVDDTPLLLSPDELEKRVKSVQNQTIQRSASPKKTSLKIKQKIKPMKSPQRKKITIRKKDKPDE